MQANSSGHLLAGDALVQSPDDSARPTSETARSERIAVADGRVAMASFPKQVETVRVAPQCQLG